MGVRLNLCNLTVEYGAFTALDGLHFSVKEGAFVALIGPNGAGKSTLLRCISRILQPTRGAIYLDDRDLHKLPLKQLSRLMAVVPQDTAVDFDFTVEEIVFMGRYPYLGRLQKETPRDREIVQEAMQTTGIVHLAQQPATSLSGGERQRVVIARALAQEPEILLLDEPTANLDINYQVDFLELARKLNREKGITIIAAIHDLNLAAQYFDDFILLSDKKILAAGKPEEVLTPENMNIAYRTPVVIGRSPLHGKLVITVLKHWHPDKKGTLNAGQRVHVIGGGEEAVPVLSLLREAGFQLSVGPVTREDSSHRFAAYHRLPVITLPPFSPISDEYYRQHLDLIREADFVVIPSIPFGSGNMRNLEAVEEAISSRTRVLILEEQPFSLRDYSKGKAGAVYERIKAKGALLLPDKETLLSILEAFPAG